MTKDIVQIRRELLAAEVERQGQSVVANKAKKADRQIADMIAGRKSFGDKIAREIGPLIRPDLPLDWLLSPSSDTKTTSNQASSQHDKNKESAMLVSFPEVGTRSIKPANHYFIQQYGAGGAMGHGLLLPDQPGVIENWSVSREWMNKNVRNISAPNNLCIVTGFGHSMQPMFNPGDPLLVDLGVKSVIADGIYFFRVGSEGFVKQLQKIPTANGLKYIAKSKNADFDTFDITQDMDFEVIGRVVRVWCGTDF